MSAQASTSNQTAGPSRPRPPVVQPGSGNTIVVNPCQRLNPILEHIRNVPKEFGDIVPDYQLGKTTCALFLSLKYHRLHPEYVHQRIEKLGSTYNLRLLLVMCDISEHQDSIRELTKMCLLNNITIMVAWTPEEAGLYLSTYKAFEYKPPDLIKERVDKDYLSMLRATLTSINRVNKMDVETLRMSFGSIANIAKATPEELQRLPGFGQVKVKRLKDAFEKPFRNQATRSISSTQGSRPLTQARLPTAASASASSPASSPPSTSRASQIKKLAGRANAPARANNDGMEPGETILVPSTPPPRPPREPSPPWDIELDLSPDEDAAASTASTNAQVSSTDDDASKKAPPAPRAVQPSQRDPTADTSGVAKDRPPRPPSPAWDIELDLNDSD